ncbi:MAG: GGDEF domain-containing protein [Gaiellaceae bacterium]
MEGGDTLRRLAADMRDAAMELAAEVAAGVEALASVDEPARFGDIPIFIHELAGQIEAPEAGRAARESPLASLARDHARRREELGLAPRDVVTEFLLLRQVLWRFVSVRSGALGADELLVVEERLNSLLDQLVAECVVAYFDRATAELARQARQDPLTSLLNHQAFSDELEAELARAKRYDHCLTLVVLDVDRFKEINDTRGHREGDAVLRRVADVLRETTRRSDLSGRMGGDEFAVALVETDAVQARAYVTRLEGSLADSDGLPPGFSVSPGWALFPDEAEDADALFRLADSRSYELKRTRS